MADAHRRCAGHRRTLANDGCCARDSNPIARTDPFGDRDAASAYSYGAADQHAIAAANPVADAGTSNHRANGNTNTTNRYRNRCAFANRRCGSNALPDRSTGPAVTDSCCNGNALPDRSTSPAVTDIHSDRSASRAPNHASPAADRSAPGDSATTSADDGARSSAAAALALLW